MFKLHLLSSCHNGNLNDIVASNRIVGAKIAVRIGMFGWLTSQRRLRAASLLVAFYALCLVAPTSVLAFTDPAAPANYVTEDHHGVSADGAHEDGSSRHHSGTGNNDSGQPERCCGLFCLSAIAPAGDFVVTQQQLVIHRTSFFAQSLSGLSSDGIDRPPRYLPSL